MITVRFDFGQVVKSFPVKIKRNTRVTKEHQSGSQKFTKDLYLILKSTVQLTVLTWKSHSPL